jgi:hypothetical protein
VWTPPALRCENLFGSDFVFSVGRDFVRSLRTPTLVLPGRDLAHPEEIALETARLAPNTAANTVRAFLQAHPRVSTSIA